ncbi:hypothetical protein ACQSSU_20455 [Micromonospora echinospora]
MAIIVPTDTAAPTAPTIHLAREIIAEALAKHHGATISLGGGQHLWACRCEAHSTTGATDYPTAYLAHRTHTAQAVLDALTRAGIL